ncbi:unnamed protein product [Cuscuta campestris]|uniref:Uncharacterized protein n=1 Tax=Cuscuta campestris TaxID=132261 RepID=A0A484N7G2_9ASTE|nr:unnamed protein product [Cuscuta campestris]
MLSFNHRVSPIHTRDGKVGVGVVYHGKVAVSNLLFIIRANQMKHARIPKNPSLVISRREMAVVTQFKTVGRYV